MELCRDRGPREPLRGAVPAAWLARREGVGVLSPNRPEVWMSQTATTGRRSLHRAPPDGIARGPPLCVQRGRAALPVRRSDLRPACGRAARELPVAARGVHVRSRGAGRGSALARGRDLRGPARAGAQRARRHELAALHRRNHRRAEGRRAARGAVAQMALAVSTGWIFPYSGVTSPARRSRTRPAC